MNTSVFEPRAGKVSFDADNLWVKLMDERQPPAHFPRLHKAIRVQREGFIVSGGSSGIDLTDYQLSDYC